MILKRYILSRLLWGFVPTFVGLSLLLSVFSAFTAMRSLPRITPVLLLETLPGMVIMVLPHTLLVALVIAVTLCYGRLAADNEIEAMRVSGVHLRSILFPALGIAVLVAAVSFWLHWDAVPAASAAQRLMNARALRDLLKDPPPGPNVISILGKLKITYQDAVEGEMKDLRLWSFEKGNEGESTEYWAETGTVSFPDEGDPVLRMKECRVKRRASDNRITEQHVKEETRALPLAAEAGPPKRPRYARGHELDAFRARHHVMAAMMEKHKRIAAAVAPILLALVAALIGVRVRRSSKLAGLGISLPPIILYYLLAFSLAELGESGTLDPRVAGYLPIAVLGAAGLFLTWRAAR